MKPVDQTIFSLHHGNCLAACIASILEMQIELVPNFVLSGDKWWDALVSFADELGYSPVLVRKEAVGNIDYQSLIDAGHYFIVTGKSPRGDWLHCVVEHRGRMVHDPHPSREGIHAPWSDFIVLVPNTIAA